LSRSVAFGGPRRSSCPKIRSTTLVKSRLPTVFLAPTITVLAVLAFVPTIEAAYVAFQDMTLSSSEHHFIGFANFVDLFSDRRFINSAWISVKWEIVTVSATMVVAIVLGTLMIDNLGPRARNFLCFLFIVPVVLPRVSAAFVWKFAFNPLYGIITFPARALTGQPLDLLSKPSTALFAVAVVDVWQWGLFFAVIVAKLIETLPREPLEAARLDHAGGWRLHAYVTLPMLRAALLALTFAKMIESLRSFDLIYVMTRGGPGIATETLDMYAYSQGFIESGNTSYASAMAFLLMVFTIVIFTVLWKRAQ